MNGGMLAMGVAKPLRITAGTMNRNEPSRACCRVAENEEIIRPTPMIDST